MNDTSGLCECGCGQLAPLATRTRTDRGQVKGKPVRFIRGHTLAQNRRRDLTLADYKVVDTGYCSPCWLWRGAPISTGYGVIVIDGARKLAHRASLEAEIGPIAHGLTVDHLCRVRLCINPQHLEVVTHAENCRRGARAKLSWPSVQAIRESPDDALTLAHRFGVSRATIYAVRNRRSWTSKECR